MVFVGKEHHLSGFHGTLSLTKNPAAIYFGNPLTGVMQHMETQIFHESKCCDVNQLPSKRFFMLKTFIRWLSGD